MLNLDDIKVEFESQGLGSTRFGISPNRDKTILFFESVAKTERVSCPACGGEVHIYENDQVGLKDIPMWDNTVQECSFFIHRYRCQRCGKTFSEEIPFKYPGTRITYRAANWIKGFLQQKISIKAIQELTGIHWDTIRKVHRIDGGFIVPDKDYIGGYSIKFKGNLDSYKTFARWDHDLNDSVEYEICIPCKKVAEIGK